MPHLVFAPSAVQDLNRLRLFLTIKNPVAANRALQTIRSHLQGLLTAPKSGRPSSVPGMREIIIPFGDGGYIARYNYDQEREEPLVIRIRHQKEAGY